MVSSEGSIPFYYTLDGRKKKEEIQTLMEPSYLKLWSSGKLREKVRSAWALLSNCQLCPRNCRVNRLNKELGFCCQGAKAKVARALPHYGEEPPLSGSHGAGTVFFSGCALRCLFCQNYQISQEGHGEDLELENLAQLFLDLQNRGCHNLDLVSPTPHLPFILKALEIAIPQGFRLPLVYNTHGYLSKNVLVLLEGIVDIYLPDIKYGDPRKAGLLSQVEDYPGHNQAAIREMFRQVGPLKTDHRGVAYRGLLVRHLILPGNNSDTHQVLQKLADLSPKIPISLMAQYRPCFRAREVQEINRPIHPEEYEEILSWIEPLGFEEIFTQDLESAEVYNPDFLRDDPFR
jgi:putative pyruvate formate lyase activating enzyme